MTKEQLMHQIIEVLKRAEYVVSMQCNTRPRSFDIAARQDDRLIFCKVLYNIDGLDKNSANEIKYLSDHLHGSAIVVGAKARNRFLEEGVVYMRHDIPSINVETLFTYLIENVPPLIAALPGGLYVSIEGYTLKNARIKKSLSLGALALSIGVSRRAISKYEEGEMMASIDVVLKLEEFLDAALAKSIDIFKSFDEHKSTHKKFKSNRPFYKEDILQLIHGFGYDVLATYQTPFKAVVSQQTSKKDPAILLIGISEYNITMIKRAHIMSSISDVTKTQSIFIIKGHSKYKSIENTVFIEIEEFNTIVNSEDLLSLVDKRLNKKN
ncbi:MAG: transcriptional regulator [Methanosarcinaceae archaeon]|nr:transcriptional regulator [Methanosarcinaceae archaeon]NKQ39056.1 transcriptional regulator [Methanosarcinales archaeon]